MPHLSKIGELVYGRAIYDVDWEPFDREARIVFDEDGSVVIRLTGVHLLCFRQSLLGPKQAFGSNCLVHLVHVREDSELLGSFLKERLEFSSRVNVIDSAGKTQADSAFRMPIHLLIVCGCGDLDAICEGIAVCN